MTIDLSYLALADAIPQLGRVSLDDAAHLLVLVKPTFELRRGCMATSDEDVANATRHSALAMESAGWRVLEGCTAPTTGRRGSREMFLLGVRQRVAPRTF